MRQEQQKGRTPSVLATLLAAISLLGLSDPALSQSFDPLDLFRQIRAARKAAKDLSKPIRLHDDSSDRSARMRLMHQGTDDYVLFLVLGNGKKLHPHTLYLKTDQTRFSLRPIPDRQTTNTTDEELVGATITVAQLVLLAEANNIEIRISGFGESLRDQLTEKDLVNIRKFCERYGIVEN